MFPIALGFGPDGGMYVSLPAIGAEDGSGVIERLALDSATATPTTAPACSPVPDTAGTPPVVGSPAASPAA